MTSVEPLVADLVAAIASDATIVELRQEIEFYRAALERIYQMGRGAHVEIARDALNG